jgi:methyl-accepting chemotaxis protein
MDVPIGSPDTALLHRLLALGTMQQRIAESLIAELTHTSGDVERETGTLTRLFQELAVKAEAQNQRVSRLSGVANEIAVNGERMTFGDLAALFDHSLADIVSKILLLSQNSMSMVYAFGEVGTSMSAVEDCILAVDKINSQMRMLAINARIEAARAGNAGQAFTVISDEVRTLSGTTQQLADTMRTHVKKVVRGLNDSHEALQSVATIDMSENIMAKERLDAMVAALLDRSAALGAIADSAAADAADIAGQVNAAITSLQFQDRVSQRLEQVVDTLRIVGDAFSRLETDSGAAAHCSSLDLSQQISWLHELASRYRLSEMRAAFVSRVIDGRAAADVASADSAEAGSIDLF